MITPVPPLTDIPEFPALSDRTTYNAKAFAWAQFMRTTHPAEMQALAVNTHGNAVGAADAATLAGEKADYAGAAMGGAQTAAGNAAISATTSDTKAGEAFASATAAAQSTIDAAALLDQFDDRYLGVKAADPLLDNDGNALAAGAIYVNSVSGFLRAYNGSGWVQGISAISGVSSVNSLTGAVTVQETLVSGTNLKTINGGSLLGGGDIVISSDVTAQDLALLKTNVAINAFRISVLGSLSLQQIADGVVDEYEDQTGIDDPNCAGPTYDSISDFYSMGASYLVPGGSGDRTGSVTVTSSLVVTTGVISNLVDGGLTADSANAVQWTYKSNITGDFIRFDFGVTKVISEATMKAVQAESTTRGFWKWQGSNDAAAWTDVCASQQLAATQNNVYAFTGNATAYRYYRMLGVSGGVDCANGLANAWTEIEFKVSPGATSFLLSESSVASASPGEALVIAWEEDVSAATLDVDILAFVSREAGLSFTTAFATDNKLNAAANPLANGDQLFLTSSAQALPAGLSTGVLYYVVNRTADAFEVALTQGGTAVVLTGNGTGTHTARRFSQATLTQAATLTTGRVLTGSANLSSQTTGTSLRYALLVRNSKQVKFHGVSLQWS